jgi:C4-dicarboxylate-specific signal transduction histidine kinase
MKVTIDHLQGLARRESGARRPMNVEEVVWDTAKLLVLEAGPRDMQINVSVSPALPPVLGDPMQLEQALLNLSRNAMDAMNETPVGERRLTLSAFHAGVSRIELGVQDAGPGVPPGLHDRIFDPFFTTKARGQGLGLGLAVTRTIIDEHRGKIWVSQPPEGGAKFHVELPTIDPSHDTGRMS